MDGAFKPTARPSAPKGAEAANRYAITSLVLGITSIVLLLAFAIGLWASLDEAELDAWVVIVLLISLVAAISASRFGARGRRLAKVGTPGRVQATTGLVLGMGVIAVLVVGLFIG
jgi:hypothetical protein